MNPIRTLLQILLVAGAGAVQAASPGTLYTLATNGPTGNRLNIVIMAEGYTAGESQTFTNHARGIVTKFLSTAPYSAYSNYFNAFAIFVASNESGSDHPLRQPPIFRDTYFNSTYDSHGIARLITIPPNDRNANYSDGTGKVAALLQELVPEYDIVLILVNDLEYGGSGGTYSVTSVDASAAEIAIHEIAHSYAALGDEYDDPAPGYPEIESANTTRETRRDLIKWTDWIEAATPIPTPETSFYAGVVGLFEGAHYRATGWYRPKLDCKMKTLGRPFCEVCSEALVLTGYRRLSMIEARLPSHSDLTTWPGGDLIFRVSGLEPSKHELAYRWLLNGEEAASGGAGEFLFQPGAMEAGTHEITAELRDPTLLVRNDPFKNLTEQTSWLVQVLAEAPQVWALPVKVEGGSLTIQFRSSVSGDLILEKSEDLQAWRPVSSRAAANSLAFVTPISAVVPHEFFRLQIRPAL